eukprot:1143240-Pelagomonas_calceolata.AAC.6
MQAQAQAQAQACMQACRRVQARRYVQAHLNGCMHTQGVVGAATGAGIIIGAYFAFYSTAKQCLRKTTALSEGGWSAKQPPKAKAVSRPVRGHGSPT